MKTDLKILREYIKQIVSEMNRTKEEASTTASVSGYTLPMGTSNKKKKRKSSIRASKGKIQEDDPFRPRQKNRGLAGQKKKRDRDAFRFSNRKQEKKKAKNRRDKNKTPKLGLQNKQPDKVKRNKKKID